MPRTAAPRAPRRAPAPLLALALLGAPLIAAGPAAADRIKNPTAVFAGLDKITGRIISFEVAVDETVQFGALQLTPRVCYSRPSYESPRTTSFVEVDEVGLQNEYKRLFGGWVFADSPGLSAIEHPIYDLWLTECRGGSERDVIRTPPEVAEAPASPPPSDAARSRRDRPPGEPRPPGEARPPRPPAGLAEAPAAPEPERAVPSRRFFPTNVFPGSGGGPRPPLTIPDPAGSNR